MPLHELTQALAVFAFVAVTMALTWTLQSRMFVALAERRAGGLLEAFNGGGPMDVAAAALLQSGLAAPDHPPTPAEASQAYHTLLRFVRADYTRGLAFVQDVGRRFYEEGGAKLRKDVDPARLLEGYVDPLAALPAQQERGALPPA